MDPDKAVFPFQFERLKQSQQIKLLKIMGDEFHYQETPGGERARSASSKPSTTAKAR